MKLFRSGILIASFIVGQFGVIAAPLEGRAESATASPPSLSTATATSNLPSASSTLNSASSTNSAPGASSTSAHGSSATSTVASVVGPTTLPSSGASLTASASSTALSSTPSATESAGIPPPLGGSFPVCHDLSGPFEPFCEPTNGSDVWVGETYHVTWNADYYPINSTITIELDYVNASGGGAVAWSSPRTLNNYGYVTMTMDSAWLQGQPRNNLTLNIIQLDPTPDHRASSRIGPIVSLINKPVQHYPPSPPTKPPGKLGLLVGLPVAFGFFLFVLLGLLFGMRKHRKIGLGSVMGSRKGYGVGKSRRQRVGNKGAIRLGEREAGAPDTEFRDEPTRGVELQQRQHAREESLDDLVSSPTEQTDHRRHGNAFRDEISRQRTGR